VKNSRIRMTLLSCALILPLGPPAAFPLRLQMKRSEDKDHPERGDVTGRVMLTLMSAILVAALLALTGPALEALFNQTMDKAGR
jgi:hypothetical protein